MRSILASTEKRKRGADGTAEATELSHEVLSALAHELGGIASALDLRAAAMARTISENDLAALRELAEQVRMATKAARLARGGDASGMLNPGRRQSIAEWWKLNARFTSAVLPRGVTVDAQFTADQLSAAHGTTLTWVWLAACKEFAERGLLTPVTMTLTGGAAEDEGKVELRARVDAERLTLSDKHRSRWSRHAAALAKGIGAKPPTWERTGSLVTWRFAF